MEDPIFRVSSKREAEYRSRGVRESSNNQFPKSWGGSGARPRQVQQVSLQAPSFKEGERGSLSYPPTASANRVARPTYRLPPPFQVVNIRRGYMLFDVTRDTVKKPTAVPVERNYSRADG